MIAGRGPSGPAPREVEFEWNVTRDIEQLDSGHDAPTGAWSDGALLWLAENGDGTDDAVYAYDLATGERVEDREFELDESNRAPRSLWSNGETMWVADSGQDRLFAYDPPAASCWPSMPWTPPTTTRRVSDPTASPSGSPTTAPSTSSPTWSRRPRALQPRTRTRSRSREGPEAAQHRRRADAGGAGGGGRQAHQPDATDATLDRIVAVRGTAPAYIRCGNGPELTANALRDWCRNGHRKRGRSARHRGCGS